MPANRTLNPERALWSSLSHWHPGAPETLQAGQAFWAAKALLDITEALSRSPLPFTQTQRDQIIAVVLSGDPAPESTPAP